MKRTVYLHIGTEKTGTTSIQNFLYNNREQLQSMGYHFIQSAGKKNNRALPAFAINDNKDDDFFRKRQIKTITQKNEFREKTKSDFINEINSLPNSIHSIIISSEHFSSRNNTQEEILRIKELIRPFYDTIKIICYLREQSAFFSSRFSTRIKSGGCSSFYEILESCNSGNPIYNYKKKLHLWSSIFGIDNIYVRIFDKSRFINNNLIDDFVCQLDISSLNNLNTELETTNQSLNQLGQILGRAINKAIPTYNAAGLINRNRKKAVHSLSNNFRGAGFSCNATQSKKIFQEFQASNREVNRLYLKQEGDLFIYHEPQHSTYKLQESDSDAIAEMLEGVVGPAGLPDYYATLFRDTALMYESKDIEKAILYMELAHIVRPEGAFISKKLREYRKKVSAFDE